VSSLDLHYHQYLLLIPYRFVLANQILYQLPDATSAQDIDQIFVRLPSSLEGFYALAIQQINEQAEDDAKLGRRVLSELLVTLQPMTAKTLLGAVAGDAGWETTCDRVRIDERTNRCVRCCRSLITRSEDNTIGFTHLTVKQYLEVHGILSTST
jgi:hypothetical protein